MGLLLTALAYLAAVPIPPRGRSAPRPTLAWIGGIALIPLVFLLAASVYRGSHYGLELSTPLRTIGWVVAVGSPLALAWALRHGFSAPLIGLGLLDRSPDRSSRVVAG